MEPVHHTTTIDGEEVKLKLPFVNARYGVHVRVVNFYPRQLEDFAVGRKTSEYDVLSDCSGDSDSSSGNDGTLDSFVGRRLWEWRFALQLEDASAPRARAPARLWAVVGNAETQSLTGLDASDLRHDDETLGRLRQQLFTLWGDLEEKKAAQWKRDHKPPAKKPAGDKPPLDSSDDERGRVERPSSSHVRNKPFACCLQQYGVKVAARGAAEANAGDGQKWERVFGMFGTRIYE